MNVPVHFEQIDVDSLGKWQTLTADNVFIKQMFFKKPNIVMGQHSHKYGHATLVAAGGVRIWKDGKLYGDVYAPQIVRIDPEVKHQFMSLEDNTVVYCVHNILRTGKVEDNGDAVYGEIGG